MDLSGGYEENPFVAEFYDHVEPYKSREDISFFIERAKRSGGPVLELGCGTGRVLVPVARAGVQITGLDASPRMVSLCRKKVLAEAETVQSKVTLVDGDMRDFDLGREFSLVTIPFRPFQHLLTVADQLSCLRSIHRALCDRGQLILDLFNPSLPLLVAEEYLSESDEGEFAMEDGRKVKRRWRFVSRDYFNQITENELIYYVSHPSGQEERLVDRFKLRYLFRYEIEHLLVRSSFEVENVYADYDESPYGSKYPGELIVVARKVSQAGVAT